MSKRKCLNLLVKGAIGNAIKRALHVKPVDIVTGVGDSQQDFHGYGINGVIYTEDAAVEKILGEYSWWK